MAAEWVEKVTGSIEQKKQYRQYKARVKELPPDYRAAVEAMERYLIYFGGISDGKALVSMLQDLADLFEQSAADRTGIRQVVGQDPVEFADTFLQNYSRGQWINKERKRLTDAIDRAAADDRGPVR